MPAVGMKRSAEDSSINEDPIKKIKMPVNCAMRVRYNGKLYNFDPKNMIVGAPMKITRGKLAQVTYRLVLRDGKVKDVPLVLQTPVMWSKFGFGVRSFDGKEENAKAKIAVDFKDQDSALLATFRAMDAKLLEEITNSVEMFFPNKNLKPEIVEHLYGGQKGGLVKQTTKNGVTYAPYVQFKIRTIDQDGIKIADVECYPPSASKGSKETIDVSAFEMHGIEFRAKLSFEGVYVGDKLSPVIRAESLQLVTEGKKKCFENSFIDDVVEDEE